MYVIEKHQKPVSDVHRYIIYLKQTLPLLPEWSIGNYQDNRNEKFEAFITVNISLEWVEFSDVKNGPQYGCAVIILSTSCRKPSNNETHFAMIINYIFMELANPKPVIYQLIISY